MKPMTPYQERAETCRKLAGEAKSSEDRELLLKIVDTWDWISRDNEPANSNEPADSTAPNSKTNGRTSTNDE